MNSLLRAPNMRVLSMCMSTLFLHMSCTCTCTCTYMCMHMHMHTHVHAHAHTCHMSHVRVHVHALVLSGFHPSPPYRRLLSSEGHTHGQPALLDQLAVRAPAARLKHLVRARDGVGARARARVRVRVPVRVRVRVRARARVRGAAGAPPYAQLASVCRR